MVKKKTKKSVKKKSGQPKINSETKLLAFLTVLLSILGFILALLIKRNDKYIMYYAKQSLIIFIAVVIIWLLDTVLIFIPIVGWLAMLILNVGLIVLWVYSLIYALSGKKQETPLIGQYAKSIKL